MDQHHALAWTRLLTSVPSRRDVLRGFGGAGLGLGITRHQEASEAKKRKHKTRKKKAKPNAFGCLSVGKACKNADQCCSGICEGKKGKRTCRNHGPGTCDQKAQGFCEAVVPVQVLCNDVDHCFCFRTTAGSNFCVDATATSNMRACVNCKRTPIVKRWGFRQDRPASRSRTATARPRIARSA